MDSARGMSEVEVKFRTKATNHIVSQIAVLTHARELGGLQKLMLFFDALCNYDIRQALGTLTDAGQMNNI